MRESNIKKIQCILNKKPSIIFAYLFGSMATKENNAGSDWDIAIYLKKYPLKNNPWIRFTIQAELSAILKTNTIDIVILNTIQEPSFAFDIINNSIILVDKNPSERIIYEVKVMNRYFDWQYFLKRHLAHSL